MCGRETVRRTHDEGDAMTDEAYGPLDFLILEFPPQTDGAATARALQDLVDGGVVRLYDLVIVRKTADGRGEELDPAASEVGLSALAPFTGARSGLLGPDDVDEAVHALDPGTVAAVLVYENAWAAPFVAAARREGAQLVASARLSAQQVMDALDALEAVH